MDILAEIQAEQSKKQAEKIAKWIGADAERFAPLMQLFLHGELKLIPRLAVVLGTVTETHRELIMPYLPEMVSRAMQPGMPDSIKRTVVRELQFVDIPEPLHGDVMNMCFDLLADPQQAVAVRAFSMTVLSNLAQIYPEIKQEIIVILEDALEQANTPGFINRALKTMKALTK